MYSISFSDEAKKIFSNFGKAEQERIISVLERCRVRPEHFLKRLVGNPYYSLRAGDLRMIMDIRHESKLLLVMTIDHRKKSYKKVPK